MEDQITHDRRPLGETAESTKKIKPETNYASALAYLLSELPETIRSLLSNYGQDIPNEPEKRRYNYELQIKLALQFVIMVAKGYATNGDTLNDQDFERWDNEGHRQAFSLFYETHKNQIIEHPDRAVSLYDEYLN